jgi:translocation and assembly module TamB
MVDVLVESDAAEPTRVRLRRDWRSRLLDELFALFVALLFLIAALLVLLDSAPGHRFIVDQIC